MATPKYVVKQIVQIPTTNQNNTRKASVVVAGSSGTGNSQNVYLLQTEESQFLMIESKIGSHV